MGWKQAVDICFLCFEYQKTKMADLDAAVDALFGEKELNPQVEAEVMEGEEETILEENVVEAARKQSVIGTSIAGDKPSLAKSSKAISVMTSIL